MAKKKQSKKKQLNKKPKKQLKQTAKQQKQATRKRLQRERKQAEKQARENRKRRKQVEQEKKRKEESYDIGGEYTATFTDSVIREYVYQISRFPYTIASIVIEAMEEAITIYGREDVAYMIESSAESLSDFLSKSKAFGDSVAAVIAYCQAMFGKLVGVTDKYLGDIIDAAEQEESYGI